MANFNLPIIGPWAYKTSHIINVVSNPCDVSPSISILAMWHSAPYLVWSLIKPDPVDFLTNRFGQAHKRRRKWRMDTVDWQGGAFGGQAGFGWATFVGTKLIERVGWYMLVVDASIDFGVHWTSSAYLWSGCRVAGSPYARSRAAPGIYGPQAAGTYEFNGWVHEASHIFSADANSIETLPGYNTGAGASLVCGPVPPVYQTAPMFGTQIIDTLSGQVTNELEFSQGHDNKLFGTAGVNYWTDLNPARSFRVLISKGTGFYNVVEGSFSVSGLKERPIEMDP